MSIFVLLSLIHFFLFFFPSLNYHLEILNHSFLSSNGDNNYPPFQKTNKVSRNNFKIDIKGISDVYGLCKNIISA